ncbi:ATP-grasp domain-containing protein [Brevibacillus humidisoli]|uniref:preATP grasp domain-containing protein n=1 Tax=Brevibacillus humidisoli TaxID=2895522 RepID=UPI001E2B71A9|nr:ATP-grasp domain-containing protein [Brevibacillus humidisoli]UFJ42420.1 ATP-grasp domain-containing protein [Brevibacillus humidisoli]
MGFFREQLRSALTESVGQLRVAWLGNFEVENDWQREGLLSLPSVTSSPSHRINDSLSELTLMLAEPEDLVLLKHPPDEDYLQYLEEVGWQAPIIVTAEASELPLAEAHLRQRSSKQALRAWAKAGDAYLLPHGVSRQVEKLTRSTNIPLAAAGEQVSASVNNKLYSRRLCEQTGIRQPHGVAARSLTELQQGFAEVKRLLRTSPLLLKEGTGVSGKGIVQIDNESRFEQILRLLRRAAEKQGTEQLEMVIEEKIAKSTDINYQFLLGRDGTYTPLYTLVALVDQGKHVGHLHPHQLPAYVVRQIEESMPLAAEELAGDGYYGMVGVDALLGQDGTLYPCIEINARLNMSTYHVKAFEEWIPPQSAVIARSYSIKRQSPLTFRTLREKLDQLVFTRKRGSGILINAFAPVNALHQPGHVYTGRLYAMVIGSNRDDCLRLQAQLVKCLRDLGTVVQG